MDYKSVEIVIGNLLLTPGCVVLGVGLGGLVASRAGFLHRQSERSVLLCTLMVFRQVSP